MLTVTEIREVAAKAAAGDRRSITLFRELATAVGIEGRPGGWIYLPDGRRPIGHGWRAAAELFRDPRGWTGKDLVVEMSKRSASPADVAATIATAYDEALAEDAHREALAIAGSIPIDGRPAEVTRMLEAAELLNDEHENLAALRAARARYDELAMNANPLKREPAPRADRLATAFARFADLADSGGPGTAKGLIAAVEGATTVTAADFEQAIDVLGIPKFGTGASDALRVLKALGFAVK